MTLPAIAAVLALAALACRGEERPARSAAETSPTPTAPAAVTPAIYRTSLTFVGLPPDPVLAHLAFENRTDTARVRRGYAGWIFSGGAWRKVLSVRDSLPAPRAAWRVLPVSGALAVWVGAGGELRQVRVGAPGEELRLEGGGLLAAWAGDGGPRESLRSGTLSVGGAAVPGLLLLRQAARAAVEAPLRGSLAVVVADSVGDGLLLVREGGAGDVGAVAWTRLEGTEAEWPDAVVRPLSAVGGVGRWAVQIPEAGILGEVEGRPPLVDEETGVEGVRLFRVAATLRVGGAARTFAGAGIEEP